MRHTLDNIPGNLNGRPGGDADHPVVIGDDDVTGLDGLPRADDGAIHRTRPMFGRSLRRDPT